MGKRILKPLPKEVDRLKPQVQDWRRIKSSPASPMPSDMKDVAIRLAKGFGVCRIARAVGLDHGWLRKKVEQSGAAQTSSASPAFLELPVGMGVVNAGTPLGNNQIERGLKRAIMHRNNSLFCKTQEGARVGDLYMSLIHSAELTGVNPFDYVVALVRNHALVEENPEEWMPWNYQGIGRIAWTEVGPWAPGIPHRDLLGDNGSRPRARSPNAAQSHVSYRPQRLGSHGERGVGPGADPAAQEPSPTSG